MHTAKVSNTKDKYVVISSFKTDTPPILGGLNKGNYFTTPLKAIINTYLWNAHDGFMGVYPRDSKYLQYQCLKLQAGIYR